MNSIYTYTTKMKNVAILALTTAASAAAANKCYQSLGAEPLVLPASTFLTNSYCQALCVSRNYAVTATKDGKECACVKELPSKDLKVDEKECSVLCPGYPSDKCMSPSIHIAI